MIKLNIGSNSWKFEGWVNIDIDSSVHPDIALDVRKGLPWSDNQVDFIFMEHFLEHIGRQEQWNLLKECYRVLKPGGGIRITGPDLQKLAKLYLSGDFDLWRSRSTAPADTICDFMNDVFYNWGHCYIPDPDQLKYMLTKTGFKNVSVEKFRESRFDEMRNLDIRSQSFNEDSAVEAEK